jgi:hypothetical protein
MASCRPIISYKQMGRGPMCERAVSLSGKHNLEDKIRVGPVVSACEYGSGSSTVSS